MISQGEDVSMGIWMAAVGPRKYQVKKTAAQLLPYYNIAIIYMYIKKKNVYIYTHMYI